MTPHAPVPPKTPSPPPAPAAVGETLVKRLARLRKRIFTSVGAAELPAADLRKASADLRRAGDLAAAEETCSRAIEIYPADLALAIEHAEIAKAVKDFPLRLIRWQRVIDLGGNLAPARAFGNLADCHLHTGDAAAAAAILHEGLARHPGDFSLLRKFDSFAFARGLVPTAIDTWQAAIETHPDKDLAPFYLQLSRALRQEGLLGRAEMVLREGASKYPEDAPLRDSHAALAYLLALPSSVPVHCDPVHPATRHLFQDRHESSAAGTLAFTPGPQALRQHVPAMLDFAEIVPAPEVAGPPGAADVFAIWGAPKDAHLPVRETAATAGKPLIYLDSGFLSSPGIEGPDAPTHSVVVTPEAVYYDATRPSHLENLLNSDAFTLTEVQRERSENCIAAIATNRLSKFNHAPRTDLRTRFPADGTHRILLVDQRKGGSSIHWSLGGQATFERMLEAALARPACQILVKIHPEVIAGSARSHLAPLLPDPLPENVVVIDHDVNPYDLLDVVDEVFVCTSQLGFEAVMAGKEVHCFAAPYYAGWGFTRDELAIPRRSRQRTPAEVFHLYHIIHSHYFVPGKGAAEIEDLITFLASAQGAATLVSALPEIIPPDTLPDPDPLRILIVIPNDRYGPTGRYSQDIGVALTRLGCQIMVLCEGSCHALDAGVHWRTLTFEGVRLAAKLRSDIVDFAPHFIYENGVRTKAQRAALEAVALTGARFALHSADDDVQVHLSRKGRTAAEKLVALDHPELSSSEVEQFLLKLDWQHSLHVLLDPEFDRWIEPILRVLCYRMASVHTAIWYPFAERLTREYAMPAQIVPPVAAPVDFARIPMTPLERARVLQRYGIGPESTVIFINGSLYSYSPEYALFLEALNQALALQAGNFALVIVSGRSPLPIARMARERLDARIEFADLGVADDEIYMEMLKACDVVCSPGLPDTFNRYRLPSRLVKAMAMAKPILTCRCGFGESLEHGGNAFLMEGENPADWAASIALCGDPAIRAKVGASCRNFALEHFDAQRVATALKRCFEQSLREPPRSLAQGIAFKPDDDPSPRPKIRLRNRHHSPLQPAIHALALRTHRLDTVVHLGAGKCDELEDYCRLGARQIALAEGLLDPIGNFTGTIAIMDLATAVAAMPPAAEKSRHLLVVVEENRAEEAFRDIPNELLQRFRWIVTHSGNDVHQVLVAAGLRAIPLPVNHTGSARHSLFEQTHPATSLTS